MRVSCHNEYQSGGRTLKMGYSFWRLSQLKAQGRQALFSNFVY